MTNKQKILEAIQRLPDDASFDRAIDELCLLQKIELGLKQGEQGDVVTHEEFKRQLQAGTR